MAVLPRRNLLFVIVRKSFYISWVVLVPLLRHISQPNGFSTPQLNGWAEMPLFYAVNTNGITNLYNEE